MSSDCLYIVSILVRFLYLITLVHKYLSTFIKPFKTFIKWECCHISQYAIQGLKHFNQPINQTMKTWINRSFVYCPIDPCFIYMLFELLTYDIVVILLTEHQYWKKNPENVFFLSSKNKEMWWNCSWYNYPTTNHRAIM